MVGEAASVLSTRRLVALAALLTSLAAWDAGAGALPALSDDWDVVLTAIVLIPATFAVVWLLLPLAAHEGRGPLALVLGLLALGAWLVGADALFNVAKLCALTLAGFWFLSLFEALCWVVLVACVIPWVDVLSVYRGPTKVVVEQKPGLFEQISIGFRLPGEDSGARLGPPDVLFFALFLASAERFGLRIGLDVDRDDGSSRPDARRDVRLRARTGCLRCPRSRSASSSRTLRCGGDLGAPGGLTQRPTTARARTTDNGLASAGARAQASALRPRPASQRDHPVLQFSLTQASMFSEACLSSALSSEDPTS